MSNQALESLEPRIVWNLFEHITRLPRCSGKEEKIRGWIRAWADERGIAWKEDSAGNLLLRGAASAGRESVPTLVLQAHLDMVCAKATGSPIDHQRDPIPAYVDGGWVRARGTTLGADNGIGIAYALGALIDPELPRGPLEVLLTVDEEGGMKGAFGLKGGFFTGRYLVNLDSEELGLITIGTAGGEYTDFSLPVRREPGTGWAPLRVSVDGLAGGHSGIDIHLPRLNAIKVLLSGIEAVRRRGPLRIATLEGGAAANVIPPSARCACLVPGPSVATARKSLERWRRETLRRARSGEPGISIEVGVGMEAAGTAAPEPVSPCTEESTAALCALLAEIPQGVLAWSADIEGLVETSNNLATVKSEGDHFEILTNARSSVDASLEEVAHRLRTSGESHGATVKQHTRYPGWKATPRSRFNLYVKERYEALLGAPVVLKAFHAGLECGVFKGVAPELEMVSLGPTLRGVHTPEEAIDVASVRTLWGVLRSIVGGMDKMEGAI
jgi:dipeptidase D